MESMTSFTTSRTLLSISNHMYPAHTCQRKKEVS